MMLDMVQYSSQFMAWEQGDEAFRKPFAGMPGSYSLKHKAKARAGRRQISELAYYLCRAVLVDRDMVNIAEAQVGFA